MIPTIFHSTVSKLIFKANVNTKFLIIAVLKTKSLKIHHTLSSMPVSLGEPILITIHMLLTFTVGPFIMFRTTNEKQKALL